MDKTDRPKRDDGKETLTRDTWRGDWYKMNVGECWIDTGQIDIHITVEDSYVTVKLYHNNPTHEALDEACVVKRGDVWSSLFGPNLDPTGGNDE